MEPLTVSVSVGKVAVDHDRRKNISKNIDPDLIPKDPAEFIFEDKLSEVNYDIEAYTNAKFQPYIDEYNVGKKPCRQIKETYCEHLAKENEKLLAKAEENKKKGIKKSVRKPTKLVYEYVVQVGNHESNSTLRMDGETPEQYQERMRKNKEYCKEVLSEIKKKYPHADILLATYHADEPNGTPHMHLLVQFTGEGYEKGLSHQISMSKALELDGFERSGNRGDYSINRWTESIKNDVMEPLLQIFDHDQKREVLNEHRKHEETPFFREKAKREAEALDKKRSEVEKELSEVKGDINNLKTDKEALEGKIEALKGDLEEEEEKIISKIESDAKAKIDAIEVPTLKPDIEKTDKDRLDRIQIRLEEALKGTPEKNDKGEEVYRISFRAPKSVIENWINTLKKIKGLFSDITQQKKKDVEEKVKTVKTEEKASVREKLNIKQMIAKNKEQMKDINAPSDPSKSKNHEQSL